jgi:hypothetical protein
MWMQVLIPILVMPGLVSLQETMLATCCSLDGQVTSDAGRLKKQNALLLGWVLNRPSPPGMGASGWNQIALRRYAI